MHEQNTPSRSQAIDAKPTVSASPPETRLSVAPVDGAVCVLVNGNVILRMTDKQARQFAESLRKCSYAIGKPDGNKTGKKRKRHPLQRQ